ncbi:MAG: hypothetical protein IKB01_13475 [Lachnospiraceae bacterium]|nr:hypothetical protein [Lachnospiraceae bacterium]
MKRKMIIPAMLVLVAVLLSVCFSARQESLGNMTRWFNEPATGSARISFVGEANAEIKLSFKSNVKAGELDIFLYDSNGNMVYELDRAKALETYYVFEKTDNYTLTAEYIDFVGNYKITVYEME